MKFYITCIFVVSCIGVSFSQTNPNKGVIDSIIAYRQFSENKQVFSVEERMSYAIRAVNMSKNLDVDSTIIKSNKTLTSIYWEVKNYNLFKKIIFENKLLAQKNKDTSSLARSYYDLGRFYKKTLVKDSSYY